jgi:hypothetical protein
MIEEREECSLLSGVEGSIPLMASLSVEAGLFGGFIVHVLLIHKGVVLHEECR